MHDHSSPAPSFDSAPRLFEPLGAERASERLVGVWILGALALHAALGLAASGAEARRHAAPPPSLVDVVVEQARALPEPAPPPNAPVSPNTPEHRAFVPVRTQAATTQPALTPEVPPGPPSTKPAEPAESAPPEAAPVLTSADPATFAVTSGSGTTVGATSAHGSGNGNGAGSGAGTGQGGAPRDLSRGAIAPDLRRLLFVNYPPSARMERAEGTATVRVTVHPDGRTSDLRVTSARPGGRAFGETCSRTVLQGPKWKPALDAFGKAVASTASYTCRFELPEASAPTASSRPTSGTGANRVWTKPAR